MSIAATNCDTIANWADCTARDVAICEITPTIFISLGALVLAALALNKSLNRLAGKEQE